MSFTDILLTLAPVVLPVLLAGLTVLVRKAWVKTPANIREFISNIVNTAVAAVEQVSPGQSPAVKKAQAVSFIEDQLAHFGMHVPESVIDPMIEEAVLLINIAQTNVAKAAAEAVHVTKLAEGK